MRHGRPRRTGVRIGSLLVAAGLIAASACGDDDDAVGGTEVADGTGVEATDSEAAGVTSPPTAGDDAGAVGEIDVCALMTEDEVEAVIGMPAGSAQPDESLAPYFGCRYEEDGLTQIVSIGVLAWSDADEAAASFEFGADQYPAIEGLGDRAYNSQPIDEVTVLAGRYELSVGLYFVSEDDATELAMARELAATALDRLP